MELSGSLEDSPLQQESQTVRVVKTTVHCWRLQHNLRRGAPQHISASPDALLSSAHCAVEVKAQVSVRAATNRKTRVCLAVPMAAYCT